MRRTARATATALVTLALIAASSPGTLRAQIQICPCEADPVTECSKAWEKSNAYKAEGCSYGQISASFSDSQKSCTISTNCNTGTGWQGNDTSWTGDLDDVPYLVNCSGDLKVYPC